MRKKILITLILYGSICLLSCQQEEIKPQIADDEMVKILTDLHISEAAILSLNQKLKDSVSNVYYQQIFEIHGVTDSVFYQDLEILRNDAKRLEEIYNKVIDKIELLNVKTVEDAKKESSKKIPPK